MNKGKLNFKSNFCDYFEQMEISIRLSFPKKEVDEKLLKKINNRNSIIFSGRNIILKPSDKEEDNHIWSYDDRDMFYMSIYIYNRKKYNKDGEQVPSFQLRMDSKYSNKEYEYFFKKNGDLVIKNIGGITFRMK